MSFSSPEFNQSPDPDFVVNNQELNGNESGIYVGPLRYSGVDYVVKAEVLSQTQRIDDLEFFMPPAEGYCLVSANSFTRSSCGYPSERYLVSEATPNRELELSPDDMPPVGFVAATSHIIETPEPIPLNFGGEFQPASPQVRNIELGSLMSKKWAIGSSAVKLASRSEVVRLQPKSLLTRADINNFGIHSGLRGEQRHRYIDLLDKLHTQMFRG